MLEGFAAAKHRGTSIGHLGGQGANRVRLHHVDGFDHLVTFEFSPGQELEQEDLPKTCSTLLFVTSAHRQRSII